MLIAQLSDLHLRPRGLPSNRVVETNMFAERAFRAVMCRQPRPDLVLLTGDVAESGLADEYAMAADLLRRHMQVPVFAIPGNHDRREAMIEHLPILRHNGGFVQYALEDFPVRVVMLDSLVPGEAHGELCSSRLEWLDAALSDVPDKPTLIAIHHPPFATGIGHMDRIALRRPEAFAAIVRRHPQVARIICGHHHRPITGAVGPAVVCVAPSVAHQVELDLRPGAPPLFRMEPPAYMLHQWTPAAGFASHIVFVEDYPGPYPFLMDGTD